MIKRRALFGGLLATLVAPAIIRTPGLLMPVKAPPIAKSPNDYWMAGDFVSIVYDRSSGKAWIYSNSQPTWRSAPIDLGPYYGGLDLASPPSYFRAL